MPLANLPLDGPQRSRKSARWSLWLGPAALLGLAVTGQAEPAPAVLAALAVAGLGLFLNREREAEASGGAAMVVAAPDATSEPSAPFAAILDRLPDPLMVIAAEEADDLTGRRFLFANAAARELFKI